LKKINHIIIDKDRCKSCGLCIVECKKTLLHISEEINASGYHPVEIVEPDKCIGCSLCAVTCPDGAIELIVEELGDE